jgi:phage-related protein
MKHEKPIYWVGTSYKDLLAFTDEAKREAGYQLHRVQNGLDPENWKSFQRIGSGVKEIRIRCNNNAFRIMYVAKFASKIYILHAFKKKSRKTNEHDIEIAKVRYNAVINEVKL